jgi:hypothetical protein
MDTVFWPTALGAALGVVAGVLVQYLFQWAISLDGNRRIRQAIAKECSYNLLVVDDIEAALRRFRNSINGDAPQNAQTFIPFGQGLHLQVNNLANSGRLYEFFDDANLKRIQNVVQNLSAVNGDWFYKQLEHRKQGLMEGNQPTLKAETVAFIDFADGKGSELRRDLNALKASFEANSK